MFSGNFRESHENEILLKDVPDIPTFDMVLGGVYAKPLHLHENNVLAVLRISNLLQFERLETECWDFILARMDEFDNSFEVLALADQLGQMRVYKQAMLRVAYTFREIRLQIEFQEQDPKLLYKLLCSDELRVNSEEDVVEALGHWIQFDKKARQRYLPQLIQAIRVPLLKNEVGDLNLTIAGIQLEYLLLFILSYNYKCSTGHHPCPLSTCAQRVMST